jgi:MraZ protein
MTGYTGQYDCKIDVKGRLKLPAGILRQLPEGHEGKLVINKGLDNNLDLYTLPAWEKVTEKLEKLNKFNSKS